MIDIEKRRRIGIKQAKRTIANIYKKNKGKKMSDQDREQIAKQEILIDRWKRINKRGVHL